MKPKRRYNWGSLVGAPTDRYRAFNGGHQAKVNGLPLEKNPFDQDLASELWVAWREGWLMSGVIDET